MQRFALAAPLVLLSTPLLPAQHVNQNQSPKIELSGGRLYEAARNAIAKNGGQSF